MADAPIDRERVAAARRGCTTILSGPRPTSMTEVLARMAGSPHLDGLPDAYGAGGAVAELEARVADLLGAEAAVYFPTGTMAQQVALRFGAERGGTPAVGLHPQSHLMVHEQDAYAALTGLRAVRTTAAPRNPTAAEVAGLAEPVGTLVLELPLRNAGFVLPRWADLVAVVEAARATGARVHLDGARLWESVPYLGRSLAEVAALADSTYVSFYKSLGALGGAALAGTAELSRYARAWRHRYGGNVYQQWPAAVTALLGLETELPRLDGYVAHARILAEALATVPGARVYPTPPHTHEFQLWLPYPAADLSRANLALAERDRMWFVGRWQDAAAPGMAFTEVTVADPALRLDAAGVVELAGRFLDHLPTPPRPAAGPLRSGGSSG
ncbi:low specificity L-threonine aldolase [Plantactinospora sp. KBS50]|uniref:threonine aldolase family protein n=1 Tax=Plantactinospora sp. KBS50 TaxID=2024580 RepID=UPI000BAAE126|nr:beta-eliminating lyase-related protein [Plantactinospora sp. KBS50]ASW55884.1 threonine aldolase [Plantactinospora sp. KBS50]